jgi:hypothetical protein
LLGDSSDDTPYRSSAWSSAYEADFQPAAGDTRRIRILIQAFQHQDGARSFFQGGIGSQAGQHGTQLTDPPVLGQESNVFQQPLSGKGQTEFWFYWIDRNVMVRVLVAGPDGSFSEADAASIALIQAAIISQK